MREDRKNFNPHIFHKIDTWSQAPGDISMAFEILRETSVVIAPQSDMPYCLLRWYPGGSAVGWPSQAVNPAAYVSLMNDNLDGDGLIYSGGIVIQNNVILLSSQPVILQPGTYVPALPQMAYCGDQWDYFHDWPTDALEWPVVLLMESDYPVYSPAYQFTTKALITEGSNINHYIPRLVTPKMFGSVGYNSGTYSKVLGVGASNASGNDPGGQFAPSIFFYTKTNSFPDTVALVNNQDIKSMAVPDNNSRTNNPIERYSFFNLKIGMATGNPEATIPAGVGIIID